jgi:hypothetical protein
VALPSFPVIGRDVLLSLLTNDKGNLRQQRHKSRSIRRRSNIQESRDPEQHRGAPAKMAPPSSQKGTGKKGGAGAMRQQQQRSRNTTPSAIPAIASLPPIESVEAETVGLQFEVFRNLTYEDMVDPPAPTSTIPDSKGLDGILSRLQKLSTIIETRGLNCDRGMRLLAQVRKHRQDEERGMEEERRQKGIDDEERERKANKKKRKATENLAPQGGNIGQFDAAGFFSSFFASSGFLRHPHTIVIFPPSVVVAPRRCPLTYDPPRDPTLIIVSANRC